MRNVIRPGRLLLALLPAGLLLLLAARAAAAAAEGSDPLVAEPVSRFMGFVPRRAELIGTIRGTSTIGGVFIVAASLVPLLLGGKLLRLGCALAVGCTAFVLLHPLAGPILGPIAGAVAGCLAAMGGGALGWHIYEVEQTLLAVLLTAACGAVAGIWFEISWLTLVLVPLLAIAGFVLSRKAPDHLGAGVTVLLGALLAAFGAMSLASGAGDATMGWIGLGTTLGAATLGLLVQLRLAKREG